MAVLCKPCHLAAVLVDASQARRALEAGVLEVAESRCTSSERGLSERHLLIVALIGQPAGPRRNLGGDLIERAAIVVDDVVAELLALHSTCRSQATYAKIRELEAQRGNIGLPRAVLALGDLQYETGALTDFNTFYDADWGPLKPNTFPAVGNHEYRTKNAKKVEPNSGTGRCRQP